MKFKDLPLIVKVAILLTFFNTWVLFEELIVDRFGYWKYLPFYKKGIFCPWDIAFIFIAAALLFANRKWLKSKCFVPACKLCKI